MIFRGRKRREQPRLMIIPMIDIIFFLLVFFMVSTLHMVEQHTIPVNLPQSSHASEDKKAAINVTILSDGQVMYNDERLDAGTLQQRVRLELSSNNEAMFVLRADKTTEYGLVVSAIDELKAAGAERLAIATERKDQK